MEWCRLYARFPGDEAVQRAGEKAGWLFILGLCYAAEQETDGFIPTTQLPKFGLTQAKTRVNALIRERLWVEADGGWRIAKWTDLQDTRAELDERRNRQDERRTYDRERQRRRRSNGGVPPDVTRDKTRTVPPDVTRDKKGDSRARVPDTDTDTDGDPYGSPPGSEPHGSSPRRPDSPDQRDVPDEATVVPIKPQVTGAPTAQTLIGEWLEHRRERPPQRFIGQVSKQLKNLLDEGINPHHVRHGLAVWHRKNLAPSTLPSIVAEVMNDANKGSGGARSTTDERVSATLALAEKYREVGQ